MRDRDTRPGGRDARPGDPGGAGVPDRLGMPDGTGMRDGTGMPDGTGMRDGTDESGGSGERELRVLLERATPRLPSPEGRLEQIRERIRRRRRRAVGATATAVTVLALAGTLLPDALRDPGPVPPAAPSVSGGPTVPPPPSGTVGERTVGYPELAGLRLRLPGGWQTLELPESGEFKVPARGFAADQPLRAFPRPCAADDQRACMPLDRLRPGGALLELTPEHSGKWPLKLRKHGIPLNRLAKPTPACLSIGGAYSYSALIAGAKDPGVLISAVLCGAEDMPESTVNDMKDRVEGARFDDTEAPGPPSTRSPDVPGTPPGTQPGPQPGTKRTGERR
ncbi:hypothetical protein ACFYT4_07430 [Streptomyces sp. NPDC004609]|uniref:hypothetical protein n=1 Tax=Streptomyces sp. NPDC004609 TaxID=3364704 RepID=UPI00369D4997